MAFTVKVICYFHNLSYYFGSHSAKHVESSFFYFKLSLFGSIPILLTRHYPGIWKGPYQVVALQNRDTRVRACLDNSSILIDKTKLGGRSPFSVLDQVLERTSIQVLQIWKGNAACHFMAS